MPIAVVGRYQSSSAFKLLVASPVDLNGELSDPPPVTYTALSAQAIHNV